MRLRDGLTGDLERHGHTVHGMALEVAQPEDEALPISESVPGAQNAAAKGGPVLGWTVPDRRVTDRMASVGYRSNRTLLRCAAKLAYAGR